MKAEKYETPLVILLGLIKYVQEESAVKPWVNSLPTLDPSVNYTLTPETFADAKRIGQLALNVYDASWLTDLAKIAKKLDIENQEDVLMTWYELQLKRL